MKVGQVCRRRRDPAQYRRRLSPTKRARVWSERVDAAIGASLWPLRRQVLTLAFDRGSKFADDAVVEKAYSYGCISPNRMAACNENCNGQLRQHFACDRTLSTIMTEKSQQAENALDTGPGKQLSFLGSDCFSNTTSLYFASKFTYYNQCSKPFAWIATAYSVCAKLQRPHKVIDGTTY
jgi:IS30 family transposase